MSMENRNSKLIEEFFWFFLGKIDKEDWNIKNIEEKLVINTQTPDVKKDKVPKWSKAAFQDKFNIMKGKLESSEEGEKKLFLFPLLFPSNHFHDFFF